MAPFATGDGEDVVVPKPNKPVQEFQTVGSDYQTPQQRQANVSFRLTNSLSSLHCEYYSLWLGFFSV